MVKQGSVAFIQLCIQYSSIALLYYDYVLTFGMEVKYVWGQKFRLSTLLYICCRYGLVANVVYLFTIVGKITLTVCDAGYKISAALSVFGRTAIIIVWGGRAWAVCDRKPYVMYFFGTIGLAVIILDIIHVPLILCRGNNKIPITGGLLSIFMVIFEICSAGITTLRAVQALRVSGPWRAQKRGFMYLLLEQGLLYFSIVTLFTVASLILNVQIPGGFFQRLLNAFTLPLSGLMTARFLLHLRKWEAKHTAFSTLTPEAVGAQSTAMDFASAPGRDGLRSVIDDFGEDPVRRARSGGADLLTMGVIAGTHQYRE